MISFSHSLLVPKNLKHRVELQHFFLKRFDKISEIHFYKGLLEFISKFFMVIYKRKWIRFGIEVRVFVRVVLLDLTFPDLKSFLNLTKKLQGFEI